MLDRPAFDHDVPASSFAVAKNESGAALMLISDSKYGFRYTGDQLALALIRASYNPDPYPEYGVHRIRLGVGVCENAGRDDALLYRTADEFLHPVSYCTADLQERGGVLAADNTFLRAEGNIRVTALKSAEDGKGIVVRFAGTGNGETAFTLSAGAFVKAAYLADLNETKIAPLTVCENRVSGQCGPYEIKTVILETE
jgi:alpha-mannosidase